jgi:hypothetical protein
MGCDQQLAAGGNDSGRLGRLDWPWQPRVDGGLAGIRMLAVDCTM